MPSPFPGMNPYLERGGIYHDFHQTLIPVFREILSAQLQPAFVVSVEVDLFIHELPAETRRLFGEADVGVVKAPGIVPDRSTGTVLEAPAHARIISTVDFERHAFLAIKDAESWEVVTVLELLSPSNKRGMDRHQYLAKRHKILGSSTHLVEIDLLRGGPRMPFEDLPNCDYCAMVSRAEQRPRVEIWPVHLRDPLPAIPVPVRAPHPDAILDLQQGLHRVYDSAGYGHYIYRKSPEPPLSPEDAAWAEQFLPQK